MWVSFPGLRGWWRSRAEKCSQSSRGEAGHSWLRGRAVEAPVCGVRAFSLTSCWGSGCWWWWAQAPTWGPQGLRKGSIRPGAQGTAPMLEASGGEIPKGAGGRGTAASWGLPLRRTHFSVRMPGARVLLLVQHVTTSVDRRWQRATERDQGWPGEVRHTRVQPWASADRTEEALRERSHVGTCRKDAGVAQTGGGGGVAASDGEWPGSHSKRSGTASGSHHGISLPEASSIGVVPWAPGRILPFLSPWGPHVGACAHRHQLPEPQQLVRKMLLCRIPAPPQPSRATSCAQLHPSGTESISLPGDATSHGGQGMTPT